MARLLDESKRSVHTGTLLDFLVYGLKVVFPAELGGMARGIPTAWSAEPLSREIHSDEAVVWSHPNGTMRGSTLAPLYASAPEAALSDPSLHRMLALTDALRIGKVRETRLAQAHLKEIFDGYALAKS